MANTTNLNLEELLGTEKLKEFATKYNSNLSKIDPVGAKTVNKYVDVPINNATISAAKGWLGIGLTEADTPVCVSYCNSSSYRFGNFSYYGTWYLAVFDNNTGAPVAAGTNIGNIKVRYYKGT